MGTHIAQLQHNPILRRAVRFAVVGALGTLIDLTLYSAGKMLLQLPSLVANTISYSAGIANNYHLHRTWTFGQNAQTPSGKLFLKFLLVSLVALLLNNLVVFLLVPLIAGSVAGPYRAAVLAKLAALVVSISWNFFANHAWTFQAETSFAPCRRTGQGAD